jgi:hypothetical protein
MAELIGDALVLVVERRRAIEILNGTRALALQRDVTEPIHELLPRNGVEERFGPLELDGLVLVTGGERDEFLGVDRTTMAHSTLDEDGDVLEAAAVFDERRATVVGDFPIGAAPRQRACRDGRRRSPGRLDRRRDAGSGTTLGFWTSLGSGAARPSHCWRQTRLQCAAGERLRSRREAAGRRAFWPRCRRWRSISLRLRRGGRRQRPVGASPAGSGACT